MIQVYASRECAFCVGSAGAQPLCCQAVLRAVSTGSAVWAQSAPVHGKAALESSVRKSGKLPDRVLKNQGHKCPPPTCQRLPRCQYFSPLLQNLRAPTFSNPTTFFQSPLLLQAFYLQGLYAEGTNTFLQVNIFISLNQKDKFGNWSGCRLNCIPNRPPPPFLCWNSHPQYLRMWLYWETGLSKRWFN